MIRRRSATRQVLALVCATVLRMILFPNAAGLTSMAVTVGLWAVFLTLFAFLPGTRAPSQSGKTHLDKPESRR